MAPALGSLRISMLLALFGSLWLLLLGLGLYGSLGSLLLLLLGLYGSCSWVSMPPGLKSLWLLLLGLHGFALGSLWLLLLDL